MGLDANNSPFVWSFFIRPDGHPSYTIDDKCIKLIIYLLVVGSVLYTRQRKRHTKLSIRVGICQHANVFCNTLCWGYT